jgi:uncharacterized BrkB/YihY/UPF0761 family membrane protein
MAFRFFKKSDLIAGVIVLGFMALLFLLSAVFGHMVVDQIRWDGAIITKSDPTYGQKVTIWRWGMFAGFLFSALAAWLCYRTSRRTAD